MGTHVTRAWGRPLQERACVPAACHTRFLCVFEKSGDSLWSPDLPKPGEASGCAGGRQTRVEGTLARADLLGPYSPRGLGRVRGQGPSVPANLAALWRAQGLSEPVSEGILIRSPPCPRGPSASPELEVRGCSSRSWKSPGAQRGLVQGGRSGGRFQAGRQWGALSLTCISPVNTVQLQEHCWDRRPGKLGHVQGGLKSASLPHLS